MTDYRNTPDHPPAVPCPTCGWRTRIWTEEAPGASSWRCVVCDLQAENELLQRSRHALNARLLEIQGLT